MDIIYLLIFGVIALPFYFLLPEIGIIVAQIFFIAAFLISMPFFITLLPRVVLENVGPMEAISKSAHIGLHNFLFNIGAMLMLGIGAIVMFLLFFTIIGIIVGPILFTIFSTIFLIKVYDENNYRR